MENETKTRKMADLVRKWCLVSTTEAGSGHPTSCMSAADLATVLFDRHFHFDLNNPLNNDNDRFILSKGHAAPLLYTLFGMAGAYPLSELKNLRKTGSRFEGHPTPHFPFAEAATGSLGQGLSVGAGMALLAKRERRLYKTFVLLGDGELAEGQVWEAANFASYYQLDNLVALLDINRLGQSGETMFGHDVQKHADRFTAFGFNTIVIDGHDFDEIDRAFEQAVNNSDRKPTAIVAKTVKGKGVSFLEDELSWHGKALNNNELEKALAELGSPDDGLLFDLKPPIQSNLENVINNNTKVSEIRIDNTQKYATREICGQSLTEAGVQNNSIYVIDGDVKNSTFSIDFMNAFPERFIEGYIAEQNMVSVAAGMSRLGKIPVVTTFGAFFTRAADQVRMARVSEANIKFIGSHVGVSIGEDGPSQMALEDIALFGTLPGAVILQPAEAISAIMLTKRMIDHDGFVYMRTLRPKTPVLYSTSERFDIGGSKILRESKKDALTVAATGITVFEALKAYEELRKEDITIRILDCYSLFPVDNETLRSSLENTTVPVLITVEDHFTHGGFGDFVQSALVGGAYHIEKMGVREIARSGKMEDTLKAAGISAADIIQMVKRLLALYNGGGK